MKHLRRYQKCSSTMSIVVQFIVVFSCWQLSVSAYEIYNTEDQIAEESASSGDTITASPTSIIQLPVTSPFHTHDDSRLNAWLETQSQSQPILAGVSPPSSVTLDSGDTEHWNNRQTQFTADLLSSLGENLSTISPTSTTTIATTTTLDPFSAILPLIGFSCKNRTEAYYVDNQFCDIFHLCKSNGYRFTFLCPRDTVYSQESRACEQNSQLLKQCSRRAIIEVTQSSSTSRPNVSSLSSDSVSSPVSIATVSVNRSLSTDNVAPSTSTKIDSKQRETAQYGQRRIVRHPENVLSTTTLISPTQFDEASEPIHDSSENELNFDNDLAQHKSIADDSELHTTTSPIRQNTIGTTPTTQKDAWPKPEMNHLPVDPYLAESTTAMPEAVKQTLKSPIVKTQSSGNHKKPKEKTLSSLASYDEYEKIFNDLDMSSFDLTTTGNNLESSRASKTDLIRHNAGLRTQMHSPFGDDQRHDGFVISPHGVTPNFVPDRYHLLANKYVPHSMEASLQSGAHLHRARTQHVNKAEVFGLPGGSSSSSAPSSASSHGSLSNSIHKLLRQSIPSIYFRTVPKLFRTLNTLMSSGDPMRASNTEHKVERESPAKISMSLDPETEMSMLSIPVLVPMSLSQDDYRRRMSSSLLKPTVIPLREKGKLIPAYVLQFANKLRSNRVRRSAPTLFHPPEFALPLPAPQAQQTPAQAPKRGLLRALLKLRNKNKTKTNMQMSPMEMAYASNNIIPFYTLPIFPNPINYRPKKAKSNAKPGDKKPEVGGNIEVLHPIYQMMNDPFYGPYRPFPSKVAKIKVPLSGNGTAQTAMATVNGTISIMPISGVIGAQPDMARPTQTTIVYGSNYAPFPIFTPTSPPQPIPGPPGPSPSSGVLPLPTFSNVNPMFSPMMNNDLNLQELNIFKPMMRKNKQYKPQQSETKPATNDMASANFTVNANVYVPDDIIDDSDYYSSSNAAPNHKMENETVTSTSGTDDDDDESRNQESSSTNEEILNTDESQLSPIDAYRKARKLDQRWKTNNNKKSSAFTYKKIAATSDERKHEKTLPQVRLTPDIMVNANVFNGTAAKSSKSHKGGKKVKPSATKKFHDQHDSSTNKNGRHDNNNNNNSGDMFVDNTINVNRDDFLGHSPSMTVFRYQSVSSNVTNPALEHVQDAHHAEFSRVKDGRSNAHHLSGFVKHWNTDDDEHQQSQQQQHNTKQDFHFDLSQKKM